MLERSYYDSPVSAFLEETPQSILGKLTLAQSQDIVSTQTGAWAFQISLLKRALKALPDAHVFFEFCIPRMGRRCDVVVFAGGIIFVIEFKVGANTFLANDIRQVESYSLDLQNFHEGSHWRIIVPILVVTNAPKSLEVHADVITGVSTPVLTNGQELDKILLSHLPTVGRSSDSAVEWARSPYQPTPSIVEAAQALYTGNQVEDIARNDAGAKNLQQTSSRILEIVENARVNKRKAICFVTGVPGAGKTLVGLDIAAKANQQTGAVYLSGNGPLVDVLREALIRDEIARNSGTNRTQARPKVHSFIQNIHHFRDEALQTPPTPPNEHVVIFDEAQRAWDLHHTRRFMLNKRNQLEFEFSEPEFLLRYVDRHADWCVVVALIGGGQEINSGEIGLQGWKAAIERNHPGWDIHYSDHLNETEYAGGDVNFSTLGNVVNIKESSLHLSVSMRSFRAEKLSNFVHHVIGGNAALARECYAVIQSNYPIRLSRSLLKSRNWIRTQARGNETKGVVASSGGIRLKPHGIFVKNALEAPNWFLNAPEDCRSCHALEDVATEFDIQGLELDWSLVGWDADFRFRSGKFQHWDFRGAEWQRRGNPTSQQYLENAYRVLLTRARQGMVIFVPYGADDDQSRLPAFYDQTFRYLQDCGIPILEDEVFDSIAEEGSSDGIEQMSLEM